MAWTFINVTAGTIISSTINNYTPNVSALGSFSWSGSSSNISQAGTDIMTIATSAQQIFTTNRFTLKIKTVGTGCEIKLALDGTDFYTFTAISNYATNSIWLTFVIDEETQHANMLVTWRDDNDISSRRYQTRSSFTNAGQQAQLSNNLYIALKSAEIPTYTWTSVPAISGKMGILSLSQVASAYLNDGEPVASAPRSYISVLSAASNVGNLVLAASLDMTKVVATYFIPDDISQEADYIKLVYKVNSEPESVSDGTAITITSGQTQTIIDGICDGNTYYFKIFTDEYTSNTVIITTEAQGGHPVWNGTLFNLDLTNTPYRDAIRYDSSTYVTVIDDSYTRPNYIQQGLLFDGIEESYSISNGILTANADYENDIAFAYDYTQSARIVPANCTFYIDMEVWMADEYQQFFLYFLKHDIDEYDDEQMSSVISCSFEEYPSFEGTDLVSDPLSLSTNTWISVQYQCELTNGGVTKVTLIVDGTTMGSVEYNIPHQFVCVDSADSIPVYCIIFTMRGGSKLRKLRIGKLVS